MASIQETVKTALDGQSEQFLQDVVFHGIHNLTNDFHGSSDAEYQAYSEEFEKQAKALILERAQWTSLPACKARLQSAIDKFEVSHSDYAGMWAMNVRDNCILLVWSCEAADLRALAMGSDVPESLKDSGISSDSPWTMWGGNEIIAAAEIGEPDRAGSDNYLDKYGDDMVSQWVEWRF